MDGLNGFSGSIVRFLRPGGRSLWTNAPLMLLSLGLATVLWAFVTNELNPNTTKPVLLQITSFEPRNVPRGMVVTNQTPTDINVSLVGTTNAVNGVHTQDIDLWADLLNQQPTRVVGTSLVYTAPVKARVKRAGVRAEVQPETVLVTLEPEVRRTVPVKVNSIDALPVGFELDAHAPPVADPPEAVVSGLKQNVDAVDAVYADLKLTGLSVSTSVTLPLSARSSDGRAISGPVVQPATATIKVTINRTVYQRDAFVGVQIHGRPAPGYQVVGVSTDTPTVTVAGTLDTLNGVTTVPTEDVELEGATQDVKRVVALRPPPGVTIINRANVTATVTIAASRGPGSLLVAPRVVGASQGVQVTVTTPAIVVTFTGPLPQLLTLRPGEVTVTVDVSNLAPGSYSLDPKISLPAGLERDPAPLQKVELRIEVALQERVATPTPAR